MPVQTAETGEVLALLSSRRAVLVEELAQVERQSKAIVAYIAARRSIEENAGRSAWGASGGAT